jgi:tetratricopeptide (TPR) repeat protein
MSHKYRTTIFARVLCGAIIIILASSAQALARGGGGGGGGHGGGGFSGGHVGGFSHAGSFSGGQVGALSHVGNLNSAHIGAFSHPGGFASQTANMARDNAARMVWPSHIAGSSWAAHNNWAGTWNRGWANGERLGRNYYYSGYGRYGWPYGRYAGYYHRPYWNYGWWWPWWNNGWGDYGDYYGYDWPDYQQYPVYAEQTTTQPTWPQYVQTEQNNGTVYFTEAANAFRKGDYRNAVKYASHAAIESPQNPKAAELMSLASFAMGDYQAAAAAAHAALAFAPPADWGDVYSYNGNVDPYTNQLRALEKYSRDNPLAPDAHFVLAYQYFLTGHPHNAVQQLDTVVKLAPQDKLANDLLKRYQNNSTANRPPAPRDVTTTPKYRASHFQSGQNTLSVND